MVSYNNFDKEGKYIFIDGVYKENDVVLFIPHDTIVVLDNKTWELN